MGKLCTHALLQVQQQPPVDLLLGTDTLSRLGFVLIRTADNHHLANLLLGDECHDQKRIGDIKSDTAISRHQQETNLQSQTKDQRTKEDTPNLSMDSGRETRGDIMTDSKECEQLAEIKLIQATRLPARHSKLIRVEETCGPALTGETYLFEPALQTLSMK